jgi:glycosyl transferase family 87
VQSPPNRRAAGGKEWRGGPRVAPPGQRVYQSTEPFPLSPRNNLRRIAPLGWIASAAILAIAFAVSPNFRWTDGPRDGPYAGDFPHEYVGGWIVRAGDTARLYDPAYFSALQHDPKLVGFEWNANTVMLPLYPPFYYWWCAPLSRLDYRSAAHLLTLLSVAGLVASVVLIAGRDPAARPWLGWWLAVSLCYDPVMESLLGGQKGTLLLLVFAGTYHLLARGKPFLAGALFALAAFKPQLLLVVVFVMLVKREWHFIAGMAAVGGLLGVQSLIVGWHPLLDWIAATLHPIPHREMVGRSHNWLGFARLLVGEYSGPAVLSLVLALTSATLWAVLRAMPGRLAFEKPEFRFQFAAIVLATPLVSPHVYTYDLSILVLPLLVLAREMIFSPPTDTRTRRTWLLALLAVFVVAGASAPIAAIVPIQVSALATFALLAVLVRASVSARAAAPPVSAAA